MAGGVVHFEIPADDEERAGKFYRSAFGWEFNPMPELNYTIIKTTPTDEAGMPALPGAINGGMLRREMLRREANVTSPVITVDVGDIDAALEKIEALGGATVTPRVEVPGMGWAAYFRDTEGNVVGLWQNMAPRAGTAGTGTAAGRNDIGA